MNCRRMGLLVGFASVLGACSSSDSDGGVGGSGGSSDASAGDGDGAATIKVVGTVYELTLGADGGTGDAPLAGVTVCGYQLPGVACATTDADGKFTLTGVPANLEGAITFDKTGYTGTLVVGTTGTEDMLDFSTDLISTSTTATVFSLLGTTYTAGTSTGLALWVGTPAADPDAGAPYEGLPGATFAVSPASGDGPFYSNDLGLPSATTTATGSTGNALCDNLAPGVVTVTVTPPASKPSCVREAPFGWPGSTAASVRVPIVAGYATQAARFLCQ